MNQKHVAIIIVIIALVGTGIAIVDGVKGSFSAPSPTPTSPSLDFVSPQPSLEPTKAVKQYSGFPLLSPGELKNKAAVIETDKGRIDFQIYPEATKAASSFIFLATQGFYDGLTFHRVVPGFVIQGGDPLGNGTGGPGYKFADEPVIGKYDRGIVAMANAGPNTNGSQFFIMLADHPELPPNYTIFGKVISGMEAVDKIAVSDVMRKVSIVSLVTPTPSSR